MAKRRRRKGFAGSQMAPSGPESGAGATRSAVVEFAEDLGRLLGTAQQKAENWMGQRQAIAGQLAEIRDTASQYLQQLTGGGAAKAATVRRGRRRGRPPGSTNKAAARKGRRKMSAAARKAISDAQKKRWAARKKAKS